MKTWYLLITLPLASGIAFHLGERTQNAAELDRIRGEVASLSTSVDEARRRGAAERAAGAPRATAPPAAPPDEAAPPAPPADRALEAEAPREPVQAADVRDHLETTFTQERADPGWARDAQPLARERVAAALPATSSLRSIECRSSMCRIETAHADQAGFEAFIEGAFLDADTRIWNGGFFCQLGDATQDGMMAVAYLARDGEGLPTLEPHP